jgi:phosphoserine phosphatase
LGRRLGIPPQNVRAVELEFNELSGAWWKYYDQAAVNGAAYLAYEHGPLTVSSGKPDIVRELSRGLWGRKLFIGDGVSDLHTRSAVDLFVGFGGVARREKVERGAEAFIAVNTLAPILPMAAGEAGVAALRGTPHEALVARGIALCRDSEAVKLSAPLRDAFEATFGATA